MKKITLKNTFVASVLLLIGAIALTGCSNTTKTNQDTTVDKVGTTKTSQDTTKNKNKSAICLLSYDYPGEDSITKKNPSEKNIRDAIELLGSLSNGDNGTIMQYVQVSFYELMKEDESLSASGYAEDNEISLVHTTIIRGKKKATITSSSTDHSIDKDAAAHSLYMFCQGKDFTSVGSTWTEQTFETDYAK